MGREKTILLGLLGLLAGVFLGTLSMKLLVPRPPAGAGPDIRTEVAGASAQERVDPPEPSPGGWDFTAAPPMVPDEPAMEAPRPVPDDGVTPASWDQTPMAEPTAAAPADLAPERPPSRFSETPAPRDAELAGLQAPPSARGGPPTRDPFVAPAAAARALPVAGDYVVQSGDTWWDLAERAYGDGRLYRALFAWNRARDPRVALAPGTRLEVPPLDRLAAAWPRLLPRADEQR